MQTYTVVPFPRWVRPLTWFVSLGLTIASVSCDAARVTAPASRSPALVPRTAVSEATELGSGRVDPPGTTSPVDIAAITLQSLVSVPESTWIVVRVAGQLDLTWNPKCDEFPPG